MLLAVATALALPVTGCSGAAREAEPIVIEMPKHKPLPPPTILRRHLHDVLRGGAGRFFARMPVRPHRVGRRFIGFKLLDLYGHAPPHPDGLHVGDVVTAVNDMPIARPEQFMKVWETVGVARTIEVDVMRREQPMRVVYRIVDQ